MLMRHILNDNSAAPNENVSLSRVFPQQLYELNKLLLTNAKSRRYAHTQQILVDHEDRQENTVFWPDLSNSCTPAPHQDGHQPAAMDNH